MLTQYFNYLFSTLSQKKTMGQLQKMITSKGAISIATALVVMASVSAYNSKKFDRGCPRVPDSNLIYGSTEEFRNDPKAFIEKWQKELGDAYSAFLFGEEIVVLSGSQVREVFLNDKFNFLVAVGRNFDNFLLANSAFTAGEDVDRMVSLMKKFLNPNLKHYTPRVIENITIGLKEYIGDIPDEGRVVDNAYFMIQHMVAKASASVFVGSDLAKNEQLIDSFKNMTVEIASEMAPNGFLEILPSLARLRMFYIGKTSPKVKRQRQQLSDALKPEIKHRLESMELNDSNWERPEDILQNIIESKERPKHFTVYQYCEENIAQFIFAALQTTTENGTLSLYRIMNHPGLIDDLLKEQNEVLESEGIDKDNGPEVFTREILNKFVKLDSAIREAFRIKNVYFDLPHKNISKENIVLSSGIIIRPGESVYINTYANHFDSDIQNTIDNLREYKPYRFLNTGKNATKIGDDFLVFGMGKHACPGRWFAVQEIKTLISYIIRKYEVIPTEPTKFPTGDRDFLASGKFKLLPR
ncbi:unnamed protein product [Cunninghamella blakesleeana]